MIFKPEDFYSKTGIQEYINSPVTGKIVLCADAADIANKLFREWLEKQPKVFTKDKNNMDDVWTQECFNVDTYQALLRALREAREALALLKEDAQHHFNLHKNISNDYTLGRHDTWTWINEKCEEALANLDANFDFHTEEG